MERMAGKATESYERQILTYIKGVVCGPLPHPCLRRKHSLHLLAKETLSTL